MSNQQQSMSSSSYERSVNVRSVSEGESAQNIQDGFAADGDGALEPKPVEFVLKEFRMFRTEHGMKGRDLVVHFFLPTRVTSDSAHLYRDWWLNTFPQVLDEEAQAYFEAGPPRLAAKYTEELASWWFLAQGYDHLLNPVSYLEKFLSLLDEACAAAPALR